jgi:hypothetical protein
MKLLIFIPSLFIALSLRSQSQIECLTLQKTFEDIKNSSGNLYIIDSLSPFLNNGFNYFKENCNGIISSIVIKRAYELGKNQRKGKALKCFDKRFLVSSHLADSIRTTDNLSKENKILRDSIELEVTQIYNKYDEPERSKKLTILKQNKRYELLQRAIKQLTNNVVLFNIPIIVDNKYAFVSSTIVSKSRDGITTLSILKQESGKWVLISKKNW